MCTAFRKIAFLLLLGLAYCGISAAPAFARGGMHHGFPDSPHNTTNGYLCSACHDFTSPDPKFIPVDPDEGSTIDETRYNSLCSSCHYSGSDAPCVKTHSSLNTSDRYGDWTVECWVCHNQHKQEQIDLYPGDSLLYSGITEEVTATTITDNEADWPPDGLVGMRVVPDTTDATLRHWNYKIVGNTETSLEIEGTIDIEQAETPEYIAAGNGYGIYLGKLMPEYINLDWITDPGEPKIGRKYPKLFRREGANSFADGDTVYDGICEVCHTMTRHFRNDGTAPDQEHDNLSQPVIGTNCIRCHSHGNGFAHGGGPGTGCIDCHGHDENTLFDPDMSLPYTPGTKASKGYGSVQSHSTHTETMGDDLKGPGIYCDTCHNTTSFPSFKSGTDANGDGLYDLSETDVCDACHSKGGTYDGIDDPVIGAKTIWSSGAYISTSNSTLRAGKEKWCAGCHDKEPSVIGGVNAPNVIGDEDGSYIYGTGWGYYRTGHGVPAGVAYPYKGGLIEPPLVGGASRPVECGDCHDFSTRHTDGLARTFDDGGSSTTDPSVYRIGYRLKLVNGQEPMQVPWTNGGSTPPHNSDRYRLCAQCHKTGSVFTDSDYLTDTNLITTGGDGTKNRHAYHLNDVNLQYAADWDPGYDGAGKTSRMTCVTCHNVHGSTQLAMVRDGKLTSREPGLKMWYYNDDSVVVNESNSEPPYPEDTPLAASDGTIWRGDTAGNLCSHCHHNDNTTKESRTPFQDVSQSPTLDWTGENGYVTDGVDPDNAKAMSSFAFRIKYTDTNNDPPALIQIWVDTNDNDIYEAGEMHAMAEAAPADINYTDGKVYTFTMPIAKFGDNTFKYRFFAADGALNVEFPTTPDPDRTVTVTNNSPVLLWTGEDYYENSGVYPATGKDGGNFTFRITYADIDGDAPTGLKQVWIDADESGSYEPGEMHDMAEVSGDYTTGMIYSYSTTLTYVTDGTVDYTFRFNDGTSNAAAETGPLSDNVVTVVNATNNPPRLDWVGENCTINGVKPVKGLATGNFSFKVKYTDPDNQCPPTAGDIQVVVNGTPYNLTAGAGNCDTGRTYSTTLQLNSPGAFSYYFTANDGIDAATGEPANPSGKQVTVVDTANAVGVRPGSGDTAPWYNSINAAVTATGANTTVLVYEGTYNENVMIDDVPATDEGIILESVCGAELTTINASGGNAVHVQAIDTSATIDGFTITGGGNGINNIGSPVIVKNSIVRNNGRGIFTFNAGNVLTVEDTVIRDNSGATRGAGIEFSAGGPHSISDSVIENNTTAGQGGALFIQNTYGDTVSIANTAISGNSAGDYGGAIYLNNASLSAHKTVISGNTSGSSGGGLFLQNSGSTTLTNCNIVDNTANSSGGGLYLNARTVDMVNCTVSGNRLADTTNGKGGGMYANNSTVSIKNSIFWANEAGGSGNGDECFTNGGPVTFTYSDVMDNLNALAVSGSGSFSVDSTNIEADPLFGDSINGDYHLKEISPAIDQGTPAGAPSDDIDGNSRPQPSGGDFDIGSDEYTTEGLETELPVVTGFTATTPSNNRNVPITLFTATDNVGVTGYVITTSAVAPPIGGAGWSGTPPVTYLVPADGTHTLYPWVRDAAGNVSAVSESPQAVDVDATAPAVTAFTATTPTNKLNIPITAFKATDTVGVAGYQITDSSTPPSAGGEGWSGTAPSAYTVGAAGTYMLYPWAKDALGNVSSVYATPQTVVVDLTPPQVSTTAPFDTQPDVIPNNSVTINWNEDIDCSTVTGSTITINPQPGAWTKTFCSGSQAVFAPDSQSQLTTYTVTVSTSVRDVARNAMAASYQFSYATSAETNTAPILSWTSENCLIDGVKPRAGLMGDTFEFKVTFTDAENQCPASDSNTIQVWVDLDGDGYEPGELYNLTEVSAGDTDCTPAGGGKLYGTAITLGTAGNLNYRFYASDGIDPATGDPTSDKVVAVVNTPYKVRPEGGSGWYSTIAAALIDAPGSSTVLVYPNADFTAATYAGGLSNTNKTNRTLQSACGADLTIISGGATVYTLQGNDGAVIDGFTITGGSTNGIYSNSDSLTVKNCKIHSNGTGLWLNNGCNPVIIEYSSFYNNTARAIYSPSSLNLVSITGSSIYNNNGGFTQGPGIYLNGGAGTHIINNSSFTGNTTTATGGAVFCNNCVLEIDDSTINNNSAASGAAIFLQNASSAITVDDTLIQENYSTGQGGAIYVGGGYENLTNVILSGNKTDQSGGAVYHGNGYSNFLFCTISGNYAGNLGGGIYVNANYTTTVKNSIVHNNDALNGGNYKQIFATSPRYTYVDVYNTLINQQPGSGTYPANQSYENMGGNLHEGARTDELPYFVNSLNPSSAPTSAGDYRICGGADDPPGSGCAHTSFCIDAASSSWTSDHDIFDGTPGSRPKGSGYDMGAHEKE